MAPPERFWSESPERVLAVLGTCADGLTSAEAARRFGLVGPNRAAAVHTAGAWRLALRQLESPLVLLLVAAALVSWVVGERDDAAIILAIVAASSIAGWWQEQSAGQAVRALLRLVAVRSSVRRDGSWVDLPVEDLVPGDIVRVNAGSLVPADARLLETKNLFVDEASLTGESFPAEKRVDAAAPDAAIGERCGALYAGTHVISGSATAVLVATGRRSEFGHVMERLQRSAPVSDFERGLQQFGNMLVRVTGLLLVGIFALTMQQHRGVLEALMFSLAIAVGITPELLPAIVTINLARGARRMAARRVIVKRLAAIENFGSMNVLCADKTGTLTEGRVTLDAAWSARGQRDDGVLLLAAINAFLQAGLPSPIDDAIRASCPAAAASARKIDEIPYDFSRKRLSVLAEREGGGRMLVTKGALAKILEICTNARDGDELVPLESLRPRIDALFDAWSDEGKRVLGVAERGLPGCERAGPEDESGMVFVGFVTLHDRPKPGIDAAIRRLRGLGIDLKMITGDNRKVAGAIARRIGFAQPRLLTGPEIALLPSPALVARVADVDVFAEVEPNQKERILRALKGAGHVVGFIGDGINDAPALHAADVGISVDSAVDVAKEAAEIVLLDHDLEVLAEGVLQGRSTFDNTLKYIRITVSANFGNMLSMAMAASFLPFLPLLPAQILLNNFLSDIPAMTIGGDRVDPEATERPGRWDLRSIRNFMLVFGAISSAFDFLTFAVLLFVLHAGPTEFRSAWFLVSLWTEVAILLIMRTRRPFLRSRPSAALLVSSALTSLAALLLLEVSPLATLLQFEAPAWPLLASCVTITALYVLVSELAKRRFWRVSMVGGSHMPTHAAVPR